MTNLTHISICQGLVESELIRLMSFYFRYYIFKCNMREYYSPCGLCINRSLNYARTFNGKWQCFSMVYPQISALMFEALA